MAETAIRNAVRDAVRDALREVDLGEAARPPATMSPMPAQSSPPPIPAGFRSETDEEAWERFNSIRSGRHQAMPHQHAY